MPPNLSPLMQFQGMALKEYIIIKFIQCVCTWINSYMHEGEEQEGESFKFILCGNYCFWRLMCGNLRYWQARPPEVHKINTKMNSLAW